MQGRVTVLSFASRSTVDRGSERCREVFRREAGAEIDSMVLTNVPFFVPENDPPIVNAP